MSIDTTRSFSYSSFFFLLHHHVNAKKESLIRYIYLVDRLKINLRAVCFVLYFSLLTSVNDRMATNKSDAKKEAVDCIYDRLRSQVSRIGSAGGITSHIFFVFGASVSEDLNWREGDDRWNDLGRFSKEENLSDTLVVVSRWISPGTYSIYWLCTKSIDYGENI